MEASTSPVKVKQADGRRAIAKVFQAASWAPWLSGAHRNRGRWEEAQAEGDNGYDEEFPAPSAEGEAGGPAESASIRRRMETVAARRRREAALRPFIVLIEREGYEPERSKP